MGDLLNAFNLVKSREEVKPEKPQDEIMSAQVFFFAVRGGFTWRGPGQNCPDGAKIVGVGEVFCGRSEGRWTPLAVQIQYHGIYPVFKMTTRWDDTKLFDPHIVHIAQGRGFITIRFIHERS